VTVSAPCRADLAGGTLDIWPLGLLHRGAVTVNTAIPVHNRLEVDLEAPIGKVEHAVLSEPWRRLSPDDADTDLTAAVAFTLRATGGVRVRVLEQAPVGSGLGGSSAYAMALARAVIAADDRSVGDKALVALVRDLEARVLGVPTGIQDHWAALRGGVLAVHLEAGGESVETISVDHGWLGERLSLFYTGITHHSGMVNWQVFRRRLESEGETTAALAAIADAAQRCRRALMDQDEAEVSAAIASEWSARKRLAPEVCPPELAALEGAARAAGAHAVKACGAGGGGSLLLWHGVGMRDELARALAETVSGGRMLPSGVAPEGCQVLMGSA
jgi:D-glycero-alpha-D-manno-heptose-7-phosphate kinase